MPLTGLWRRLKVREAARPGGKNQGKDLGSDVTSDEPFGLCLSRCLHLPRQAIAPPASESCEFVAVWAARSREPGPARGCRTRADGLPA